MDIDPPKRWKLFKAEMLYRLPQDSRKKIKRLLKLGDDYRNEGEEELAEHCYHLSRNWPKKFAPCTCSRK